MGVPRGGSLWKAVALGSEALNAHEAGSVTPESNPRGRIFNLGNVSTPGPRHPTSSQAMA
jgi:hypothetical protein